MTNTDIEMIDSALIGTLHQTKNVLILQGDLSDTPPVILLLIHLCEYKKSAVTNNNKKARGAICIGGVMTPILIAYEVPITSERTNPRTMDFEHLHHCEFLEYGMVGDMHLYRFEHPTNKKANILLPCTAATHIIEGENIDFEPETDDLYIERLSQWKRMILQKKF